MSKAKVSAPDGRLPEGFEVRVGPAGMENNISKAKGKAEMNFKHPQITEHPGGAVSASSGGVKHRAVTGAAGMPKGA